MYGLYFDIKVSFATRDKGSSNNIDRKGKYNEGGGGLC